MAVTTYSASRLLGVLVIAAALVGATTPSFGVRAQTQDTKSGGEATPPAGDEAPTRPTTGVDGSSYASPHFGFTVSWDEEVWSVADELVQDGYDGLQLESEFGIVYVEGYEGFDGDASDCLADATSEIGERDGVSDLAPARDLARPVPEAEAGEAVLYTYTLEFDDGTTLEIAEYVECRTLVAGEAVLELTFQTPAEIYATGLPEVEDLFASLELAADAGTARRTDELPGRAVPIIGAEHVAPGEPHEPYNSTPPTSGPHWPQPAPWGVYDEPLPDELQVHNLEHGGVMLQYGCDCPEAIAILETFADPATGYPVLVIAAPYPDMEGDVALTAWGRILELSADEVTADVVREFVEALIDQGPEKIHTEELEVWRNSDAPKP